ncbi:MAG: PDZ domain-containing protein [Candidatus Rokubacteria bacterium]|nr:PDZ domain-containing protein [Candidatus Rokubacteria bacterium]MBI3106287.1 PDZ domain-containing protein [Candidatus Rokubacteria bacterium]
MSAGAGVRASPARARRRREVEIGEVVAAVTPLVSLALAARSGIWPGDVIVAFQGKPLRRADELRRLTANAPPGSDAALKVRRGGTELAVKVRLGELPEAPER